MNDEMTEAEMKAPPTGNAVTTNEEPTPSRQVRRQMERRTRKRLMSMQKEWMRKNGR